MSDDATTGPLSILYQDDDVVVVDKPSDLLVHRTAVDGDNDAALQRVRDQIGQWVYPVHRLDRPTSGALVFGLTPEAASQLAADFREHAVDKQYLAIVRGWPAEHDVIDRPLSPDKKRPARASRTRFTRLATVELPVAVSRFPTARYALVRAVPESGRRHQIRRHLNGISHPIVGDVARGDRHHNRFFRERFDSQRLLLHAQQLAFRHPVMRRSCVVQAPLPTVFQRLAQAFDWSLDASVLGDARSS